MSNRNLFGSSRSTGECRSAILALATVAVLFVSFFAEKADAGELEGRLDAIASRARASSSNAVGLRVAIRVGDELIFVGRPGRIPTVKSETES